MRFLRSLTLGAVLLSASSSFAMSQSLPKAIKDELISRSEVHQAFSLIGTDGAAISFRTSASEAKDGLVNLPPERGASHSSCGDSIGDVNLIISLTDVTLRVVQSGVLSSADSKILQKVPRCEPYLELLGRLGRIINRSNVTEQDVPKALSVIKTKSGMALQIQMESGRKALFRISDKVKGVESAKDLAKVRLDASSTGQNVGVSFSVTDLGTSEPSRTRSHESCTIYETFQRCDRGRDGKRECRNVTESIPGYRRTVSDTTFTSYEIAMRLTASNGSNLLTAKLSDGNFDSDTRKGECYPDDHRRRRF